MTAASYFTFVEPAVPLWGKLSVYSAFFFPFYFIHYMSLHIINIKSVDIYKYNCLRKMLQINTNLTIIIHALVYPTKDCFFFFILF